MKYHRRYNIEIGNIYIPIGYSTYNIRRVCDFYSNFNSEKLNFPKSSPKRVFKLMCPTHNPKRLLTSGSFCILYINVNRVKTIKTLQVWLVSHRAVNWMHFKGVEYACIIYVLKTDKVCWFNHCALFYLSIKNCIMTQ